MTNLLGLRVTGKIDDKTAAASSSSGGWPNAGKAMINSTEYDTIALAITAAATGDIIKVGQGTDSGGITVDEQVALVSLSPRETIITHSTSATLIVSAANVTLVNLYVISTGAGIITGALTSDQAGLKAIGCIFEKITGAPTTSYGALIAAGDAHFLDCKFNVTTGTNKNAIYQSGAASTVILEGGEVLAGVLNVEHASAVLELRGVKLASGVTFAGSGTVKGWYYDADDNIVMADNAWIGLGSGAGRIEFDDQATDEINILNAVLGIGTSTPNSAYSIDATSAIVSPQFLSHRVTGLADDGVTSTNPSAVSARYWFFFITNNAEYFLGLVTFGAITQIANSGCSVVAGNGTLSGTTGPDGTLNLRANNQTLYIENRLGGARNLGAMIAGGD